MQENQELVCVFHNPNTMEETLKYLSEWFAKLCMPIIEDLVITMSDSDEK